MISDLENKVAVITGLEEGLERLLQYHMLLTERKYVVYQELKMKLMIQQNI